MSGSLALRLLQNTCGRTLWGLSNQGTKVLIQKLSVRTLTSFPVCEKYNANLSCNILKSSPQYLAIRTSSSNVEKEHNHAMLWTAERILSLVLLGAIPAAIIIHSPATEYFLSLCLVLHSHWGLEAIVVDYLRPSTVGKILSKISLVGVYVLSAVTLGALCYFTYTDVGLINAAKLLWKL